MAGYGGSPLSCRDVRIGNGINPATNSNNNMNIFTGVDWIYDNKFGRFTIYVLVIWLNFF